MKLLVIGGAGFIGSNFVRMFKDDVEVVVFDSLTYAGLLGNIEGLVDFHNCDIFNRDALFSSFESVKPTHVINFAAESHVDRSIEDGSVFLNTNVVGVFNILDACRQYGVERFLQVSTDEVYGSLMAGEAPFTEDNAIVPNSPYSASKASADLFVRSYVETHGLDAVITRCSNNYGAYQFPEKLIPLFVTNLIEGRKVPLYGDGKNIRDWIHVSDHCRGIWDALIKGEKGGVYNFGGGCELQNVEITHKVLELFGKGEEMIEYVEDRKGHDRRYAVDYSKATDCLGWKPEIDFEEGLSETIQWYKDNKGWWSPLKGVAHE